MLSRWQDSNLRPPAPKAGAFRLLFPLEKYRSNFKLGGSFYCGTDASDYENDVLFRVNPDETIDIIDEGVKLCNGMGFSPDETIFYSTDTIQKIIYKWDYNKSTREISNKRVFVKNDAPDQGLTDGMTIDSEGYVWSAIWWGSKVMRFDPDGKLPAL